MASKIFMEEKVTRSPEQANQMDSVMNQIITRCFNKCYGTYINSRQEGANCACRPS